MKIIKFVLSIMLMTLFAYTAFMLVLMLAKTHGWERIKFPQASAAGCLAATLVPLFVYAKSRETREQVLTIVQTIVLLVTAGASSLVPLFDDREGVLFALWFVFASVGVTTAVLLTYRLKLNNGERLTSTQIDQLRGQYGQIVLLESYFEEEVQRLRDQTSPDVSRSIALGDMLRRVRAERLDLETYLHDRVSFRPPPVFGGDQSSTDESDHELH